MELASGPARGEVLRFFYAPGYPFQDAIIKRHGLPLVEADMDTVVGRSFSVFVSVITQGGVARNQIILLDEERAA